MPDALHFTFDAKVEFAVEMCDLIAAITGTVPANTSRGTTRFAAGTVKTFANDSI